MKLIEKLLPSLPNPRTGKGDRPEEGGCIMQVVDLLRNGTFTDAPSCVHPVIRNVGITVNDQVDTETRHRLWLLVPRMVNTASVDDPLIAVKLAIWAARRVLKNFEDVFPEDDRPRKAIEAAEAYVKNPKAESAGSARSAAESARSAAESAAESARSAAESAAWSAAWSAAESAWSAAWSARSAAESAAGSARSAAWSAGSAAGSARSAGSAWSAAESAGSAAGSARSAVYFDFFADLLDEFDRLTGHKPARITRAEYEAVAKKVKSVA